MSRSACEIRMLTVPAVVQGERAILLDRRGRAIGRRMPLSLVSGPFDFLLGERWRWRLAVDRMLLRRLRESSRKPLEDSWSRKAESLARSFYLRSFDIVRPRGRCRFEKYRTTTWKLAAARMWQQANNRARRHSRSGWVLWAHTVSSNHNKRRDGRYGKAQYRDRQDDP